MNLSKRYEQHSNDPWGMKDAIQWLTFVGIAWYSHDCKNDQTNSTEMHWSYAVTDGFSAILVSAQADALRQRDAAARRCLAAPGPCHSRSFVCPSSSFIFSWCLVQGLTKRLMQLVLALFKKTGLDFFLIDMLSSIRSSWERASFGIGGGRESEISMTYLAWPTWACYSCIQTSNHIFMRHFRKSSYAPVHHQFAFQEARAKFSLLCQLVDEGSQQFSHSGQELP